MPPSLLLLFACAAGLCVANVYYAQPLLDALAADMGIVKSAAGAVVTAAQLGSALALLLLVPLGDLLPRRRLMLWQLAALAAALAGVCMAPNAPALMIAMLAVGMLGTAMTQGLIAYAASAAGDHERGRVVGMTQGGVLAGLLLARVFSGAVTDLAGWRAVYAASAAMTLVLALLLSRRLPAGGAAGTAAAAAAAASTGTGASAAMPGGASRLGHAYLSLIGSMFRLLRHDRMLQVRGVLALLLFAVFSTFWSALVFLLAAPPYGYSHGVIGAFGLAGLAGALAAGRAGRWADRGHAQRTSAAALLAMLLSWLPLALAPSSLAALIGGILLLDLGVQALHVTNQSLILRADASQHSRLIGAYMLFYAVGSGAGALAATHAYGQAGWQGVCWLGAGLSLAALLFWAITKVACPDCKSGRTNLEWPDQINV